MAVVSFDGSQNLGVATVVIRGKFVLLGKRKNAYKSGSYGLPGGRLEIGESLETCCRRELTEETGMVPVRVELAGVVREWQGDYDFVHFVYVCREFTGEPQVTEPDKCEVWEWFSRDALPAATLPGHKAAISFVDARRKTAIVDFPRH
jgi:8-oxo-dGTP diphosphatase